MYFFILIIILVINSFVNYFIKYFLKKVQLFNYKVCDSISAVMFVDV